MKNPKYNTPEDTRKTARFKRRLTLRNAATDRPFLDRWGLVWDKVGGFYIHHIAGPDPGLDVHDHPWAFRTFILWGGYSELCAEDIRVPEVVVGRRWARWSWHSMPLTVAHRIISVKPRTWTLVLRGPTRRAWGFYVPAPTSDGVWWWVKNTEYDYATRRPNKVTGNHAWDVVNP